MKTCFKCGLKKPLDEFYKHPRMADGHVNKCKECNKKDVQGNYRKNIDHYIAYEEKRRNDIVRSQRRNITNYELNKRNPLHSACRLITFNAIRSGKIAKKPCEVCGKSRVEVHHNDYADPFDVAWFCKKHHLEKHGKEIRRP